MEGVACPSVGSTGHPHTCNLGCKFYGRVSGCKDGRKCLRCHVCPWQRHQTPTLRLTTEWQSESFVLAAREEESTTCEISPDPSAVLLGDSEPSIVQMQPQEPFHSSVRQVDMVASEPQRKLDSLQKCQQAKGGTGQAVPKQQQMPTHSGAVIAMAPPPDFFLLPPSLVRNGFVEHVPPPPMPFVVNANIGNSLPSISVADSVGSVGHPHSCGKSCKYVRRKTGCTNGSQCLDCHQCQWRRQAAGPPTQMAAEAPFSRGARPKAELADTVKAFNEDQGDTVPSAPSSFPSVGSIGHPFSCCGVGCKFKDKVRGCKDGPFCAYCHLCHWHRGTSLIDRQPGVHHS